MRLGKGKAEAGLVKVPRGKIGRMVFAGGQVAAAFAAWRAVKDAKSRGDRLAEVHSVLTGAVVLLTLAVALRTVREPAEVGAAEAIEGELVRPRALPAGSK
jgi:hypothetical protein